jgi:predicted GNAT family acetyltransferase
MSAPSEFDEVVVHVPERRRYELHIDGREVGQAEYVESGGVVVITHTGTSPRWQGQGVAGRLTRAVLDDVRRRGLKVIPRCGYSAAWIRDHPDYADLLAP